MSGANRGESRHETFERYVVGCTAILCAAVLVAIAVLGPLGLGVIQYRTSQSAIYQTMGQDLADLLLLVPLLLIGGGFHLRRRDGSKYFLVMTSITLIYTGLSYGIGQEWSNPAYTGNVENYFWFFWAMVVGGIIIGMTSLSMFTEDDAPEFGRRGLRVYVGFMSIFLLLFALMWSSEVFEVMATGATTSGSYESAPTVFWVIRYLDLGVSIPLGFISIYLLVTRPKQAYPVILLFFGFFVTLGTAVNTMAVVQVLSGDPEVSGAAAAGLVVFPVLGILSWGGFIYLVKDKIRKKIHRNRTR